MREGLPGSHAELDLRGGDPGSRFVERRQLLWIELPQSAEPFDSRIGSNADQRQARRSQRSTGEPRQVPDQEQLVEQVVLEPEHDLVVLIEGFERRVPLAQGGRDRLRRATLREWDA